METPLTFNIEEDELEIFLQDVNEHLQAMETGILRLEQARPGGAAEHLERARSGRGSEPVEGRAADPEILNSVFRAAHTIKAVAATVGHQHMAELTHTLETFFAQMREDRLSPTQAVTDELLATVDALRALRDEVVSRLSSDVDVTPILTRLRALMESAAGEASEAGEDSTPARDDTLPAQQQLTEEQLARAQECAQGCGDAGDTILEVKVTAGADASAPAARLLQAAMALEGMGQVIAQHPTQDELLEDRQDGRLWLVLATQADEGAIEELLSGISELAEFQVQPYAIDAPAAAPSSILQSPISNLPTVRISVERLDTLMNLVGELVTDRTRLVQIEDTLRAQYGRDRGDGGRRGGGVIAALGEMTTHFGRVVDQLQQEVMQARMLPIAHLFDKFPRLVRDVARAEGKQVELVIVGEATELDRSVIEAIGDPLIHLLRNAVDHGIEAPDERVAAGKPATGSVWLTAAHEEGHIVITVEDDGRGIEPARIRRAAVRRGLLTEEEAAQLDDDAAVSLIFQPNLSTAEQVTDVSGRGVGLDVVRTNVKQLSGSVVVESEVGRGTTFRLTLPLTLAIVQSMLVALGEGVYAIPLTSIVETLYLSDVSVSGVKGSPVILWRDSVLPLVYLRRFFAHPRLAAAPLNGDKQAVVTVAWGKQRVGLIVDRLIGKREIVIKSLSPMIGNVPGISGCTILGDGHVVLIVDIPGLISATMQAQREGVAT